MVTYVIVTTVASERKISKKKEINGRLPLQVIFKPAERAIYSMSREFSCHAALLLLRLRL